MVQLNFDANGVAPLEERGARPAGWYNVALISTEAKATKDGGGAYLECKFEALDGLHKGASFYTNLNIRNSNPKAVEIAYRELSAIGHACGIFQIADSQQLHNIPIKVKVKVTQGQGYGEKNEIIAYKPASYPVEVVGGSAPGGSPFGRQPAFGQQPAQQQPFGQQQQPAFGQQPAQGQPAQGQPWQQPAGGQPWQQPAQQPAQQVEQQPAQNPAGGQPWQQTTQQQNPAQQNPAMQQNPAGQAAGGTPPWLQNQG